MAETIEVIDEFERHHSVALQGIKQRFFETALSIARHGKNPDYISSIRRGLIGVSNWLFEGWQRKTGIYDRPADQPVGAWLDELDTLINIVSMIFFRNINNAEDQRTAMGEYIRCLREGLETTVIPEIKTLAEKHNCQVE